MTITPHLPDVVYGAEPRGYGPALPVPPRWIIIHDTSNTASARNEAHNAANRTDPRKDWSSAHFYVDQAEIIGSVSLLAQAWGAFNNANAHGWQIEMCGKDAGLPSAVPDATIRRTAELVAKLVRLGGIPLAHVGPDGIQHGVSGIAGHFDFTAAERRAGGHTDPGTAFDWHHFIELVGAAYNGTPAPVPTPQEDNPMNRFPTLRQGVGMFPAPADPHVMIAQELINLRLVGIPGAGDPLVVDGRFGPKTDARLRFGQVHFHVADSVTNAGTGDGILGPSSLAWLMRV